MGSAPGNTKYLFGMLKPHHKMYIAGFLTDFAIMSYLVAMPFFVFRQLGGGAAMSGTFGAAQGAAYALVCLTSSRFVLRAKNGLNWAVTGLLLNTLFIGLVPFFRSFWVCGFLGMVGIGGLALVWPALHSYVGGEPDRDLRSRRMSGFNLAWSLGFALSPLLAGRLFEIDYRLPFVVTCVLNVTVVLVLRSLPHEHDHHGRETAEALEFHAEADRASERFLYSAWLATLMGNFLAQVARTVFPRRVEDLVAAGELRLLWESAPSPELMERAVEKFSVLVFSLSLVSAIVFLVMGHTRFWRHRPGILFGIQASAALAFYVLGSTQSLVVMAFCFVLVGLNAGFSFFSSVYYSVSNWQLKHRRTAINEGVVGLGGFTGCLLFGYLAKSYGLSMPFHYTPLMMGAALVAEGALLRLRKSVAGGRSTVGSSQ